MPTFSPRSWLLAGLLALAPLARGADDLNSLVDGLGQSAAAGDSAPETPKGLAVAAEAVPAEVAPGGKFEVVVHVLVPPKAHAFPDAQQKGSQSSSLYFLGAGGLQFEAPVWPKALREKNILDEFDNVYKGEVLIRVPGTAGANPGVYTAKGAFKGAYCDDAGQCYMPKEYPWQAQVTVKAVAAETPAPAAAPAPAAPAAPAAPLAVAAETLPAKVAPGGKFELVLRVTVEPGLHTYPDAAQNPTDSSTLRVTDGAGLSLGKPVWPQGTPYKNVLGQMEPVYFGQTLLHLSGFAPAKPGTYAVKGIFKGYYCDDKNLCYPPKEYPWSAQVVVEADAAGAATPGSDAAAPESARALEPVSFDLPWGKLTVDPNTAGGLALFLLLAAIGGLVLNFMPCVLPVIPIKILGLAQAAGTRNRRLLLGGVMSGGVIALWLGLGSVLAFSSVLGGTADIFRHPWVNLLLGLFIVLMALMATGLFALRLPQFLYRVNPKHDSLAGSFGFGLMTGVFALPCTGPFMGTAAATVLGAGDAKLTLAVFGAIGLGMALPYFVLAANPKWVDKLPRSGPASDVMKNFLGWLMLAGGVYFIQSGITQWVQPESHMGKRLGVMVALAVFAVSGLVLAKGCAGLWKASARKFAPGLFLALGLCLTALGAWQVYEEIATLPFPFARFVDEAQLPLGRGKITVVDFRSTNCLNCDYNEKTVFNTPAGKALLGADDVAAFQANIDHPADAAFLQKLSKNVAVPFLAVYGPDGKLVEKMSAIITTEQLRQAIEKARGGKK